MSCTYCNFGNISKVILGGTPQHLSPITQEGRNITGMKCAQAHYGRTQTLLLVSLAWSNFQLQASPFTNWSVPLRVCQEIKDGSLAFVAATCLYVFLNNTYDHKAYSAWVSQLHKCK